ncbi:RNA polymerase factor sigma-54 [Sphingorhabdus arenilitoris]|uniref:RNA polymerase sigma-54 factor n=1 Tax=Sphingorhabdus arenilitoris TaxID=1490041 RepID=A0ABV8RKR2_9SPHN
MALSPRLDLRQSQSLVMSPQMQQAIKLLALSSVEIEAYISEAIEKNPLLESGGEDISRDTDSRAESESTPASNDAAMGSDEILNSNAVSGENALDVDYNSETYHSDSASDGITDGGGNRRSGSADDMLSLSGGGAIGADSSSFTDGPDFDRFAAADISLRDHLMMQAGSALSGREYLLVQQLIENIENSGYLGTDLLGLAHRLGVPMAEMEAALEKLQTFDPTGVGARNLSECIALQAKEADRYDPAMARLIDNLDLVARGGFDQLKRLCRVDDEDLRDMLCELRSYDPKPGSHFGEEEARAVTPDIYLNPRGDGWTVELNSANLPRLLVNRSYAAELSAGGADKATKAWLNEALADAHWLIKAMDQRQRTIIKTVSEIVKQQDGFFRHGVAHLRPLTLRQVAEAIDMHESTISRVTSNKYLCCDRGLFELKYFFTSGVASDDGEGASAEAVKSQIKALIDGEGDKILSDDKLVLLLKKSGFDLARRTVAKYREAMGIGSSVQRRRARKMGG